MSFGEAIRATSSAYNNAEMIVLEVSGRCLLRRPFFPPVYCYSCTEASVLPVVGVVRIYNGWWLKWCVLKHRRRGSYIAKTDSLTKQNKRDYFLYVRILFVVKEDRNLDHFTS